MARFGNNPAISQFLKAHNQLFPKAVSGARSDCGTNPWKDTCDPVQISDRDIVSVRADIPLQVDDQTAWLSVTTSYKNSTGEVLSVGSTVYGATNNATWRNYAPPVASYSANELTIITNLSYSTGPKTTNTNVSTESGYGEISGTDITINMSRQQPSPSQRLQTGILFSEMSIVVATARGRGFIQLNGTKGAKVEFELTPAQ